MAETSHASKYAAARYGSESSDEDAPGRQAFWIETGGIGSPFSIGIRFKDGRASEGFSASLYMRHKWLDGGGKVERLVLLFSIGGIYLEGQFLQKGLEGLEAGKLRRIREMDESEIKLIERDNLDIREPEKKEPIVSRIVLSPSFERVVESHKLLGEIAKVMKERA